jgi:hypothetical protein
VGCPATTAGAPFGPPPTGIAIPSFHGDPARLGWTSVETALTRASVASSAFGARWSSPRLDEVAIGGVTYAPHLYASPLYLDDVTLAGNGCSGLTLSALFLATSNGYAYAVNAFDATVAARSVAAGTILWSTRLGTPAVVPKLDGGMPLGVLGTPVIDRASSRLYVASLDATAGWQAWALDLGSGAVVSGWPVALGASAIEPVNGNAPSLFAGGLVLSQRGALALSPAGDRLYVPFGAYSDGGVGWMVAVDTATESVVSSFAVAATGTTPASGGIWGAGGPAVDDAGRVYATTGNTPDGLGPAAGIWGESLLAFAPGLTLDGTYTPFNYCALDAVDADLGGSSPLLVPDLTTTGTSTPHLIAFGSKQGNVYLLDRDHLPGALGGRQACSTDSTTDHSLVPPGPQPQFGARGPLNVFGPYTEAYGSLDYSKMRSTPAYFVDASGASFLFVSGSSKAAADSQVSVAPSVARLRIVTPTGAPAYLAVDAFDSGIVFVNPGAPVVSSNGPSDPIVWVLDENARRVASLLDPSTPHPILYAVDGGTLQVLWQSAPGELELGGKYSTVAVAHGRVFVGTDRARAVGAP